MFFVCAPNEMRVKGLKFKFNAVQPQYSRSPVRAVKMFISCENNFVGKNRYRQHILPFCMKT